MNRWAATMILFPSARHASVRAVAEELARLPPTERASAWRQHSRRLARSRRASGATPDAVVADVIGFRDAVRVLVGYLETDPTRSRERG